MGWMHSCCNLQDSTIIINNNLLYLLSAISAEGSKKVQSKVFVLFYCLKSVKGYFFIMKLVFVSNYFNHHQKALCQRLYSHLGEDFSFIATKPMREERRRLGYDTGKLPEYVICAYDMERDAEFCIKLIDSADAVLIGSAPEFLLKNRKRIGRLILRYSERPFKNGFSYLSYIPRFLKWHMESPANKPIYMLCASAYTAGDYAKFLMYRGKTYKWGYFPDARECDIDSAISQKTENSVLWCGRFIDWKHPDDALEAVNILIKKGYDLNFKFIGTGDMEDSLKLRAKELGIEKFVEFAGSMSPDSVRDNMVKSRIYLVTSDFKEGWGAVVNEAMASGCAVVASHAAGSVPYLIQDGDNGLVYESGNVEALSDKIEKLLVDSAYCEKLGKNAYETISKLWNADVAADRLLELADGILKGKKVSFKAGPCSKADSLKNDRMKNKRTINSDKIIG